MSDNLKRYCAIQLALKQLYPSEPTGNLARHLNTLAALVSGIVGSKKCYLPAIANKMPDGRKRESRSKRFARFLQNPKVTPEDILSALRASAGRQPAERPARSGHGRQPGRAWVHGFDAQCSLSAR